MRFWTKFYLKMAIPLFLSLALTFAAALKPLFQWARHGSASVDTTVLRQRAYSQFAFFGVTLYTFVVSSLVSPLKCTKQSNGSYFIAGYPSEPCYAGEWQKNIGAVVFFIILYGAAFPIWLAFVLFYHGRGDLKDSLAFTAQFGLLTRPYRRKVYYWEIVHLLRRTSMVLATSFWTASDSSYGARLMAALSFLMFFVWLDVFVSPYAEGTKFVAAT
jgi:hypothetical protein